MDKALACRAGGWGSSLKTRNILVPLSSRALSLTMPVIMCSSVCTCYGEVKIDRNHGRNPSSAIYGAKI